MSLLSPRLVTLKILIFYYYKKYLTSSYQNYINQLQSQMSSSILGCDSQDFDSCKQQHNSSVIHGSSSNLQWQQNNLQNRSLQENIGMLGDMIDRNNRSCIRLVDIFEKLQTQLEVLKKICSEQKALIQKNDLLMKRKLNQTADKNGFYLEIKVFGCKQYKYQLALHHAFEKKLYKNKNFDISVKLIDSEKNIVPNQNLIPVTLSAYISDQQFNAIRQNKVGESIFKGNREKELHNGIAEFNKIQFREVSSNYIKKWVYFVIYAKTPTFNYLNNSGIQNDKISPQQIRPLIISEVVIKSKKK